MPGKTRVIDPLTGDYKRNAAGTGHETTTSIGTAVYHQLKGRKDSWWGDPDAGSTIHLVRRGGTSERELNAFRDSVLRSLQRLVEAGLGRDPTVTIEREGTRVGIRTTILDDQHGELDVSKLTAFTE